MKFLKYSVLLGLVIGSFACTTDFETINTNPNAPIAVQPSLLLRQVIYDYGDEMAYEGFVAGNLLGQYFTAIDFNLFDRHSLMEPQFGGNPWPVIYTNLRDNELILDQVKTNTALAVYEGPALIMKAYLTMALTDIFGNVPYSEALQGADGQVTPAYDEQEAIYTGTDGILAVLDQGIAAIANYQGSIPLQGDLLFNGDLAGWTRFANSLRIKALVRISDRVNVAGQLQTIYAAGNYLQTNDQNATFDFNDGQPNNFRMANLRAGDFNLFIMSETMEDILVNLNDPRRAVWFRPFGNDPTQSQYAGLLNGPDASQTSISVADYSLSGTIFRERTGDLDANFLTAWETHFLLAEAAEKGLLTADAKTLYERGVAQAFDYWQTELPADYLSTGPAAYGATGANKLEQIITQKWLANIVNGYEGWIEYRRTGFPALKTIAASLNNNLIPVRMPYPTEEAALNPANYNAAATATNGNSINSRVWWDN
ncbi:MAG: SusD/RagB family nutrient-binding outer membrane lipoprotein [Bacteroidetes bacterium]|nr:MAG: SusD/RagB family nutrient-binding outer membrane lipoprotein [Bacteroidota bacterium]PTM14902.1 MAG: SusD/RagB family nutrient-binding outer membrane lipoprotein [Bacteroidota bacterium]